MRARAVIGANFGDEGKGLFTDYLCATQGAGMVIRFNGGAQAGHTVETPQGQRHVFSHFGSGAFCEVPTFLSSFFIINPLTFLRELEEVNTLGIAPRVYAHPNCRITTFADMVINQRIEDKRGAARHGSVGVGINETFERSHHPGLLITMADLWNGNFLSSRLAEICGKYAAFRTGSPISNAEAQIEAFIKACEMTATRIHPLGIGQCVDPVFEGAQGLLLDQDNKEFFPHVTRSNTGMKNVHTLCQQAGIEDIEAFYVSRTYVTRHGAGPLPGEDPSLSLEDKTNTEHPYQGKLRFAPLDTAAMLARCKEDAKDTPMRTVLTHCDQRPPPFRADFYSYGPTRDDVERNPR